MSDKCWKPGECATLQDIRSKLDETGAIVLQGDILLINFGWLQYWSTGRDWRYYVDNQPGLTEEVAEWVMDCGVKAVGTDTAAVGTPVSNGVLGHCFFHERVLRKEIYLIETLANLELLTPRSFFMAARLKIKHGSGSPIRAVAFIES